MVLSITSNSANITTEINAFNRSYHADYFSVRCLAKSYLSKAPSAVATSALACALSDVLARWGAGKRRAPSCQTVVNITSALNCETFRGKLVNLESSINYLQIKSGQRSLKNDSPFPSVTSFDDCLIDVLIVISEKILVGNTNVTYPMKALLLLTGLMPAFDSQVKGGLAVAGVSGVINNQYLLPTKGHADAQKICALPFYIADCISQFAPVISAAITASSYPALTGEHGRIFDVLLFMQKRLKPGTAVVTFAPPTGTRWYAI